MKKIPNYQIDSKIATLTPFENYNGTIVAWITAENHYKIVHWNTDILDFNLNTYNIDFILTEYRSMTTSTLVGRILRSLPRSAVTSFLSQPLTDKDTIRRFVRMARL